MVKASFSTKSKFTLGPGNCWCLSWARLCKANLKGWSQRPGQWEALVGEYRGFGAYFPPFPTRVWVFGSERSCVPLAVYYWVGQKVGSVRRLSPVLSSVRLFATTRTIACLAPLFMGFSRQKYWSGLPCSPPGDLPDPEIKHESLASPEWAGPFFFKKKKKKKNHWATWATLVVLNCPLTSFETILLNCIVTANPVRPTEGSTWWKQSAISQQRTYNLSG